MAPLSSRHNVAAPEDSPTSDVAPPGSRPPFRFHLDKSPTRQVSRATRQSSRHISNPYRTVSRAGPQFKRHVPPPKAEEDEDDLQDYSDGKRGPTSPFKNPTPKRRRTINDTFEESEASESRNDALSPPTQDSHAAIQAVIRQNLLNIDHDNPNAANADIMARRHILRPRNPTPSQRRREEIEAEIMEATEAFMQASPKLGTICEQLEPSMVSDDSEEQDRAAAVANEVAMFTMKRQAMRSQHRKRSVTTQDFLDEALKIMNFIRTKGRPTGGLGDLEEASEFDMPEASEPPSASLTFERPPSREGRRSTWRNPNKRDSDPSVINHLRKYEERDSESFLSSSLDSVKISRLKSSMQPEETSENTERGDGQTDEHFNRPFGPDDCEYDPNDHRPQTGQSAESSLGHTIATTFSRRSDQVATLAPEAVAHLIPQQIAGMSFNREKKIWVRQKSPSKEHRLPEEEHSNMNQSQSEEDPFGNIPDLSVSETKENIAQTAVSTHPQPTAETLLEDDEAEDEGRPMTCASSVPSKSSNNFGWSFTKTETRATSCSTQVPRKRSAQKAANLQTTYAIPESEEDDIEHEIQYFEGRNVPTPRIPRPRVRDITISFAEREMGDAERRHTEPPYHGAQPPRGISGVPQTFKSTWSDATGTGTLPRTRPSQRPRLNGEGDLSVLEELPSKNYRMELSMNVSAPVLGQGKQDGLLVAPSSPLKGDVTFMLSELPEFTINQADEFERPDRVVVKHDGTRYAKGLEDRYAQGTAELVRALQDIEPDEPYWEDLRELSLCGKNLGSMHRLDELCYRLEELDVSDNNISQVEGIPYAMRRLQAQNNSLTGLTSWATLGNLQHLDISNNDIDSLDGLAELVHLRVLKVDNNRLKSLDSILHLDGLIELRAGGNDIDMVDFARSNLKSLTDLDLRKNRLLEVRNVHRLSQLQHLNLGACPLTLARTRLTSIDDNELDEFPLSDVSFEPCKHLRSIRLCRNGMVTLDVNGHFPKLESLYIDSNSLVHVNGLEHLRRLRTFSAREQSLGTDADAEACVGNLVRNTDVHNLYISLNPAYTLGITQHLLNLQRLELASMGLKELPNDFGQLTPNIRSINLNFNSIQDLRPLLNIKRLSELLLAGNKVERLRQNVMVLGKFSSLAKLDWRDNPVTLRFYASASENRVMSLRRNPDDEQLTDRFTLPRGDAEADEQHQTRLDYETRIRRRVTEMMLANLCRNLRELDGLPFDKARVLVKDDVWERLTLLGVIRRKQPEKPTADDF
ncbi:hypothetical protein OPT61_g9523 [Boeremia exigua]|uniref:Uncharacterized protein n=1 Tax=Boeremia exigua TaxID=749465 RepID=A0ACC2HTT2_9PLEO|nr:hypothetical protein OPT61_g9523 [Boeremia exigua]